MTIKKMAHFCLTNSGFFFLAFHVQRGAQIAAAAQLNSVAICESS